MLANEFLVFEHSPLFFVEVVSHCSLLRTCRARVEEKEEFLVYPFAYQKRAILHISRLNGKTRLNRCKIGIGGIWRPYLSQKISENNRAVKSEL